jgi:hypothetical protein
MFMRGVSLCILVLLGYSILRKWWGINGSGRGGGGGAGQQITIKANKSNDN